MEPSAPPPPSYDYLNKISNINRFELSKSEKINRILDKYEIDMLFSEKLCILEDFDIVLLLDDSGSMNTPIENSNGKTRWDELKEVTNICFEISMIFDQDGIDIYFLNREALLSVNNMELVNNILNIKPNGRTPLTDKCNYIFEKYLNSSKPVLLVIATDGVPTNNIGNIDTERFKECMRNKVHSKFFVSFLACSDNDDEVGYLNYLDKKVPNVDTLDDYHSELKEVRNAQGANFKYSLGDHTARLLLGPICEELDSLDENKLKRNKKASCNCNIL